jgi:hypothetical protein
MSQTQELVRVPAQSVQFNFFDAEQFATMQRVCTLFANSELVPEMYRISEKNPEKKAIANCMIAIETAQRIGASPLMVMQNMYIVYGQPAWSSKFLIATVNGCGRYNSLKYKMRSLGIIKFQNQDVENWECIAYTSEKGSDEILESIPVTISMAIAEGWYGKNGSKWKTIPKLMLQYRSATFWTRAYAPELSMGIKSDDEVEDYIEYEDVTTKVDKEIKNKANSTPMIISEEKPVDQTAPPVNGEAASPNGSQTSNAQQSSTGSEGQQEIKGPGF